jgi:hypothetical protein
MEFYSNSKPDLVGPKIKKTVYNIMKKKSTDSTISDKISNIMSTFYKNYIEQNKLITFFMIISIIFLIYRYYTNKKNGSNKSNEEYINIRKHDEQNVFNEILNNQTAHLRYDSQPSFNKLHSVKQQAEPINYPPNPLPIRLPEKGLIYAKNIYPDPDTFTNLNTPNYNYDNVYQNPTRSYYTGTRNTYENAKDTNIYNHLSGKWSYPTNFNTSTGDFVQQMTTANNNNIVSYQTILDNMNNNLTDSLKLGPKYIDINSPELEMEPPYATEI